MNDSNLKSISIDRFKFRRNGFCRRSAFTHRWAKEIAVILRMMLSQLLDSAEHFGGTDAAIAKTIFRRNVNKWLRLKKYIASGLVSRVYRVDSFRSCGEVCFIGIQFMNSICSLVQRHSLKKKNTLGGKDVWKSLSFHEVSTITSEQIADSRVSQHLYHISNCTVDARERISLTLPVVSCASICSIHWMNRVRKYYHSTHLICIQCRAYHWIAKMKTFRLSLEVTHSSPMNDRISGAADLLVYLLWRVSIGQAAVFSGIHSLPFFH